VKYSDLVVGMAVYWRRGQWSGHVLGWTGGGRNASVHVLLSGAPMVWALSPNGTYDRHVPVKALRVGRAPAARPKAVPQWGLDVSLRTNGEGHTSRHVKTLATARQLVSELRGLVRPLRGEATSVTADVVSCGRRVELHLSAQDATAVLAALRARA